MGKSAIMSLLLTMLSLVSMSDAVSLGIKLYKEKNPSSTNNHDSNYVRRYGATTSWANISTINTPEALAGLAKQACREMFAIYNSDTSASKPKTPPVMAALRVAEEVTLSSSAKGFNIFYSASPPKELLAGSGLCPTILFALQRCTAANRGGIHGNEGRCAELHALQAYCVRHKDTDQRALIDAYMVAVNCAMEPENTWVVVDACSGRATIDNSIGCKDVLDDLKVPSAPSGTTFVDPTEDPESSIPNCVFPGSNFLRPRRDIISAKL